MSFRTERVEMLLPVTVYRDVRCDRCDTPLPEQPGLTDPRGLQYDNALVLRIDGGYGMFTDPFPGRGDDGYDPQTTVVLCHACGHALAEFLHLDVHNWHTHAPHTGQHPDHHDGAAVAG